MITTWLASLCLARVNPNTYIQATQSACSSDFTMRLLVPPLCPTPTSTSSKMLPQSVGMAA